MINVAIGLAIKTLAHWFGCCGRIIMRIVLIFLILNCLQSFAQVPDLPRVKLPEVEKPKNTDSVLIDFISCDATFPGGIKAMKRHIQNYRHNNWDDEESYKRGYVSFVIEADGSLMDIEIVRGISLELDDLMLRIVEEMPKWIPACDRNGPVRSRVRLPITFLKEEE